MDDLRRVRISGLPLLGQGRTASVYALSEDEVLKVFLPTFSPERIREEYELTQKVCQAGIPCAEAREMVLVRREGAEDPEQEVLGIRYERVPSGNMNQEVFDALRAGQEETLDRWLDYYVAFARKLHSITVPEKSFPDIRVRFRSRIQDVIGSRLDESTGERMLDAVKAVPSSSGFLHGDLNFTNVPLPAEHPKLFDVGEAAAGDAAFDLYFLAAGAYMEQLLPGFMNRTFDLQPEQYGRLRDRLLEKTLRDATPEEAEAFRRRVNLAGLIYVVTLDFGMSVRSDTGRQRLNQMADQALEAL